MLKSICLPRWQLAFRSHSTTPRAQRMLPFVEGPHPCRLKHCVYCGVT